MSNVEATQDPAAEPAVAEAAVGADGAPADVQAADDAGAAVDAAPAESVDAAPVDDPLPVEGLVTPDGFVPVAVGAESGITIPEGVEATYGGSYLVHEYRGEVLEIDKVTTSKSERREQIAAFEAAVDAELDS